MKMSRSYQVHPQVSLDCHNPHCHHVIMVIVIIVIIIFNNISSFINIVIIGDWGIIIYVNICDQDEDDPKSIHKCHLIVVIVIINIIAIID